ncbi:MAG: long-chain-fatty-acid--CoA ligase [Steroidobacteraceae bacterium]
MRGSQSALQTMADLVDRNDRLYAAELHLIFGAQRSTFARFGQRARQLASALYGLGLRHQDRVSILAMNCPQYLDVYGACEVAALIVNPVNYRLAPPEIAWIVRDAAPKALIVEQQYVPVIERLRAEMRSVEHYIVIGDDVPPWASGFDAVLRSGSAGGAPMRPRPGDVHAIMYTSGTTGRPKGAMITHAAMLALCETWASELGTDLGHKILLSMPFFHIGARSQGAAATVRGGTLVVLRAFDAREVLDTVQRERITQLHLAPTLVQAVLDLPDNERFDLSSLRTINYAAAPMPLPTLRRAIKRFGAILINGYGQTEGAGTTLRKHYHRPDGTEQDIKRLSSVGQAVLDTQIRIAGPRDEELPNGEVGEICIKSPQNMVGYWNNSAATVETLRGGWLHTGDLGYIDEDGFVYLVDRKKDMIISGGENVYSREVEEALMAHATVADAAVIGVPDPKWGEAVKGIVVLKPQHGATPAELIAHCRTLIAGYKCPKSIDFVPQLPRLASGKVNKIALRAEYASTSP